jgi:hypothetical protein
VTADLGDAKAQSSEIYQSESTDKEEYDADPVGCEIVPAQKRSEIMPSRGLPGISPEF